MASFFKVIIFLILKYLFDNIPYLFEIFIAVTTIGFAVWMYLSYLTINEYIRQCNNIDKIAFHPTEIPQKSDFERNGPIILFKEENRIEIVQDYDTKDIQSGGSGSDAERRKDGTQLQ